MKKYNALTVLASALVAFSCASTQAPNTNQGKTEQQAQAKPNPLLEQEWRKAQPAAGPTPELKLPTFEKAELKNGLTVMVSESRALPLVAFTLVTKGGSSTDPKGQEGITVLGYDLIGEGAGKLNAMQFSDRVADLGAAFSTGADQDSGYISISGLSRTRDGMLELLSDATLKPRLQQKDFKRIQKQTLAGIVQRRGSPQGLAFEYVPAMIYGAKHPYGHPTTGTENTVKRLRLRAVQRHIRSILKPQASAFVAVGDISLDEAKTLAQKYFGRWRGAKGKLPGAQPAVEATDRKKVTIVHKDNSPQTMVVIGRPIFGKGNEDETALILANEVYGGTFSSRLNMKLREEKGYTYGAHSSLSLRRGVGAFLAYSMIRTDVTAPGLGEFFTELKDMKSQPPSEEEVSRAKAGLIRSLPGDFERIGNIASAADTLFVYDLALSYFEEQPKKVEAVTADNINQVVDKYMTPGTIDVLLVGDSAKIQPGVAKLDLGEVEIIKP